MTTRPGNRVLHDLRFTRAKRRVVLTKIIRRDGFTLRVSDHDRALTFDGEVYEPVLLGAYSADRREAGLRTGDQEVRGVADGETILIADLKGNLYRGAEVRQVITDWSMPWAVKARHRRWVRSVARCGDWWVATLEGRTQELTRPRAGKLGGQFSARCVFQLGDPHTCRKDVSIGSGFAGAGAKVDVVLRQRWQVDCDVATWPGTFTDDYFRDGSFTWMWSAPDETGTTTASTTATTLTDSGASWTVDEHAGKWVLLLTGAGGGVDGANYARIASNTATVLTFETSMPATFGSGKHYAIAPPCANHGHVSAIAGYVHSTRVVTLLLPTPYDIQVGDSGIWVAGCDGLLSTCRDKFANSVNFGGRGVFAPNGQEVIAPAGEA